MLIKIFLNYILNFGYYKSNFLMIFYSLFLFFVCILEYCLGIYYVIMKVY